YYETLGGRHPRPRRGLLTRPPLSTVLAYRHHVTAAVEKLLVNSAPGAPSVSGRLEALVTLGIAHEEQHQELLLTDILHLFAQNPLRPAFCPSEPLLADAKGPAKLAWIEFGGTIASIGHAGDGFAFDCEGPRHDVLLQPFRLANRPATNAEWIAFIEDGGYRNPLLWLSDGWDAVQREDWKTPLYWHLRDGTWWTMTLRGAQPVDPAAPVCHISYYEADAFATWCGKRLPTEYEWEHAAAGLATDGNFAGCGRLRPRPSTTKAGSSLQQMFGDVWEWTRSPFTPYPRFTPEAGAVGEYNGKFMCGQFVLRGGSCATPDDHIRRTTRNFFQPDKRWQFSGLRLAQDA
ncbi:MAG: ergothioneine biosynthesis protein EgtB, partial [Proteobacteria bacterium]|nr:ergothioneine biosynthesis protein EgtB [Pseudomonadota bacterium]